MRVLGVLLAARVRMVVNGLFRRGREHRARSVLMILFAVAAEIVFFRMANAIFDLQITTPHQLQQVITGSFAMLGGFVFVTSITFALSSLYFARDLETLLTAPIAPRQIILSRLYAQLAFGMTVGGALIAAPLIAYLRDSGHLSLLPAVFVAIACYAAIPMALATGMVILGLRLIPARYVRDGAGAAVTLAIFIVAAINIFLRGGNATLPSQSFSRLPLLSMGSGIAANPLAPTAWAGKTVFAAVTGDVGAAWLWCLPLLGLAVVLPPAVAWICQRAYVGGFQRNAEASSGNIGSRRRKGATTRGWTPPLWVVLALKDLRQIRRDASQLGQLALPLVLFALYLGSPGRATGGYGLPSWLFVALSASFASLLFAANIALRGTGIEGQRMWVLRTSPLDVRQFLAAKFASGFVVAALPATVLFAIGEWNARVSVVGFLVPLLRLLVLMATITAIAVGLGALRPRLDWTDPRRAVGIVTTLVYLAIASAYVTGAFIMFGAPYAITGGTAFAVAIADVVVLAVSAAIVAVMSWSASLNLARLEL